MFQLRRYAAALVAASALTLGACGNEVPTAPENGGGSINDNPLMIQLSPAAMIFESATASPPSPQTLAVSGLVAIGSAVEFGAVNYGGGTSGWLRVNPAPTFRRDPLAWLHTVSIDGAAWAALPNGVYAATVPVIVRAAQNSPQMLTVYLCKGATNCLVPGSDVDAELTVLDPTWDRDSDDYFATPGTYPFDDYYVFIPPHTQVAIEVIGEDCDAGYTHEDNYLHLFELDGTYIDSDDDGGCGNDSYLEYSNPTGSQMAIIARASSYDDPPGSRTYGTYHIVVTNIGAALREAPAPEAGDKPTIKPVD